MAIHLFIPCLIDQFSPETGFSSLRILEKLGHTVSYSQEQLCCGQPFFKTGYWEKTRPIAKKTINNFRNARYVVAPSGSCVNMIRHHYEELFRDDPVWLDRAGDLSSRVFELTEFLVKVEKIENIGGHFNDTVTYHDSCQVLRGLSISSEPRKLLKNKQGVDFIEMEHSHVCCGFGGVFSFKFPHISKAMVRDKVNNILRSRAHIVTGCEISCLMHIRGYLDTNDIPVRTMHVADILAKGI